MPHRSPNIFRISATPYGPEDLFTAHLGYLFDNVPELGQAWLDHLRREGGLEPDRFSRAGKHADGSRESQPDFLIEGVNEDVLCEHKLGASLGERQLERYLEFALARGRETRLAFITGTATSVAAEVLASAAYVGPRGSSVPHFRWEELYPLVSARAERLAREFTAYMEDLGLRPCQTSEWADLFTNPARVADFVPQWADTVAHFRSLGAATVIRKTVSPGLEVRGSLPWLPQLYLKPVQRPMRPVEEIPGPYISATIAVGSDDPLRAAFEGPDRLLAGPSYPVLSLFTPPKGKTSNRGQTWCREYVASLDSVVSTEPTVMRASLLRFARTVFDDLVATRAQHASGSVATTPGP